MASNFNFSFASDHGQSTLPQQASSPSNRDVASVADIPRSVPAVPHDAFRTATTSIPSRLATASSPPGIPSPSRPDLPNEVLLAIIECIGPMPRTLLALSRLNSQLHRLIDEKFWTSRVIEPLGIQQLRASDGTVASPVQRVSHDARRHICQVCETRSITDGDMFFGDSFYGNGHTDAICWPCRERRAREWTRSRDEAMAQYNLAPQELQTIPPTRIRHPSHNRKNKPRVGYPVVDLERVSYSKHRRMNTTTWLATATRSVDGVRPTSTQTREVRKAQLETSLAKRGILLRPDSKLARSFINDSWSNAGERRAWNLEKVVDKLVRTHLLFEHTSYPEMLSMTRPDVQARAHSRQRNFDRVWRDHKETMEARAMELLRHAESKGDDSEVKNAAICSCGRKLLKGLVGVDPGREFTETPSALKRRRV